MNKERVIMAASSFCAAKAKVSTQYIEYGKASASAHNSLDKATDNLMSAVSAEHGDEIPRDEMYVAVLHRLTTSAEYFTLHPEKLFEKDARQIISGLNLLNGAEQEAIVTWLSTR